MIRHAISCLPSGDELSGVKENRLMRYLVYAAVVIDIILLLLVGFLVGQILLFRPMLTPDTPALHGLAADAQAASPATLSDLVDQIAFRCDLPGAQGLCIMGHESDTVRPLAEVEWYEAARAAESTSADGRLEVFSRGFQESYSIFLRHTQGGWMDQLTVADGFQHQPSLSPDGKWLAYVAREEEGGGSTVWLAPLSASLSPQSHRPLTESNGWRDEHPSWSSMGDRIVFSSDRDGNLRLYVAAVDTGDVQSLSPDSLSAWDPVWIKSPSRQRPAPADPHSAEALGLGIAFDNLGCRTIELSVGDSSGASPVTRVLLMADDVILHDSGSIEVSLYSDRIQLENVEKTRQLTLQAWNTQEFSSTPKELDRVAVCTGPLTPTPSPTQPVMPTPTWIVIVPDPTPENVFAAATLVIQATEDARIHGTATPTPPNLVTATPRPSPIVVTATPMPENEATREYLTLYATAVALTTGTPTPLGEEILIATDTPIPTATHTPTNSPTPTNTPVYVEWQPSVLSISTPTPTPSLPELLVGKILFRSDRGSETDIFVMQPDGTLLGRLTSPWPYHLARQKDSISADGIQRVFSRDDGQRVQIFYYDAQFKVERPVTRMGAGTSWDPAIAPNGWQIAFVSNEPGNDELFVINRDGSGLMRLTDNTWEWDRHPSWSPEGSTIVFWSNRTGMKQIFLMAPDGSNLRRISDGLANDWDPVWVR